MDLNAPVEVIIMTSNDSTGSFNESMDLDLKKESQGPDSNRGKADLQSAA